MLKAKEAKEANKVMSEFIDNLNHELRTPLNAMIGISESKLNEGIIFTVKIPEDLSDNINNK